MQNKKVIIWDFDGPIVDSRELALELTQYQYRNVTADIHRNLFNGNIFTALSKLDKTDFTPEGFEDFKKNVYHKKKLEILPVSGIKGVMEIFSANFTMVVNSSSGKEYIDKYLEKYDLAKYFQKTYGNEIKSKEEKFKLILGEFGVAPTDCVMITDTLGDVLEAKAVGIPAIAVLWGYQERANFDSVAGEVIFVEQPSEIIGAVKKLLV